MFVPFLLPGVVANEPRDPFARLPNVTAQRVVVAEFFLRSDFVLLGTPLKPVGDGGQCTGTQALGFQCQPVAVTVHLFHHRNGRHLMFTQPLVHGFQKAVGMWMLRPGVRKGDEVNGNPMLMKPNQKGGTVRAAPKRYNIQFFIPPKKSPVHQAVALDALVGQGITLDFAGVAGITFHGVDPAAVGAHHNAHMVGSAVQVPIEEDGIAGGDVGIIPPAPLSM